MNEIWYFCFICEKKGFFENILLIICYLDLDLGLIVSDRIQIWSVWRVGESWSMVMGVAL